MINVTDSNIKLSPRLQSTLQEAEHLVVFTGAGMSAESGVPTFRGDDGLWKKFKPEELANFDAFIKNPNLIWEWYKHRKQLIESVLPNAGHYALAQMQPQFKRVTVITQNIDNLHQRAGSRNVYELHGNIMRNYCIDCGKSMANEEILQVETAPRCSVCNGLVRPDVVWFGEMLPEDQWSASVAAAEQADLFFSVGTSSVVYPAASLPLMAKRAGAFLVEVNIEPTELSNIADEVLLGPSGKILPAIVSMNSQTLH
jgi:NAD-dependent deacetylase